MSSSIAVNPNAFITEAEAESYVMGGLTPSSSQSDVIVTAINSTVGLLKNMTGRILKARTFSLQRSASVALTANGASATLAPSGSGALATLQAVHVGDDVVSTIGSFPAYARVTAAWNGSAVTIGCPSASSFTNGSGDATFGCGALIFDGPGSRSLGVDEWPLKSVYAAYNQDVLGNLTALNLGSALIEYAIGKITLFNDTFYTGQSNIAIECRVGYEAPSGTTLGDPDEWERLKTISLRLVQLYWQEYQVPSGRNTDVSGGPAHATLSQKNLPADLLADIMQFARIGL